MKKTLLFLLVLLSTTMHSQVVELQKLSTGELVQGQPLFNRAQDDIYGYFFIFKKDRLDKKEFLYEYSLLDKNLNKVLSGEFTEVLGSFGRAIEVHGIYREGYISLRIDEKFSENGPRIRTKYRVLDIKANSLSEPFILSEDLEKIYDRDIKSVQNGLSFFTFNVNSFGYNLNTPRKANVDRAFFALNPKSQYSTTSKVRGIYYFDAQLNRVWSYAYNTNATKKKHEDIVFLNNKNQSDFVIGRRDYIGSKNETLLEKGQVFNTFLFFNKETGKLINEFSPFGTKEANGKQAKDVSNINVYVQSDKKVVFLDRIMSTKNKKFVLDEEKVIGFSKSEYDILTGKELSRHFFTWDKLAQHLPINENGYINEKGEPNTYLYLHDAILKPNGNFLFITEQYKTLTGTMMVAGSQGVKINDMILFEVDKDMNLVQYKRVAKESKNIRNGVKMEGLTADLFGAFDYSGYQDLGDDRYLFYYFNKQKVGESGRKQWILGIVSYEDGAFKEQKLPLKSSDGSELSIVSAKNGYIMIIERFKDKKKGTEIRLEKVN